MSQRFPNATYPLPYAEADMAKADDVPTNADGGQLTITEAAAGFGPLLEHAMNGSDVKGLSFRDGNYPLQQDLGPVEEEVEESVATVEDV